MGDHEKSYYSKNLSYIIVLQDSLASSRLDASPTDWGPVAHWDWSLMCLSKFADCYNDMETRLYGLATSVLAV